MSRHIFKGIVFSEGLDVVAFEFGTRQDAEFAARAEKRDRDHQGARELKCMVLGEGKIVRHLKAPSSERANPARWVRQCPSPVAITAKALAERPQLASGPPCGLIVEDPGTDQEAITRERNWIASVQTPTNADHSSR